MSIVVQKLSGSIPVRKNSDNQNIDAAWFNTERSALRAIPGLIKVVFDYEALQTAALTNTVDLFTLVAREQVEWVQGKHTIAFTGAPISAVNIQLGISTFPNKYTPDAFDIFQAVADTAHFRENLFLQPESYSATTTVQLLATADQNLSNLTQGSCELFFWTTILP